MAQKPDRATHSYRDPHQGLVWACDIENPRPNYWLALLWSSTAHRWRKRRDQIFPEDRLMKLDDPP